jgi:hypothetical protein
MVFLLGLLVPVAAQEADEGVPQDDTIPLEEEYRPFLYTRGDQTLRINLGVLFPLFFTDTAGSTVANNLDIVGGTGSFAYTYFLSPTFFIGGKLGGMFAGTIGKTMLFIIPITAHVGYQLILGRFEIPLSISLGIAPQTHLTSTYLGFFAQPELSVFFRLHPDWSLGLNAGWWFVPEWGTKTQKDIIGHFFELTLAVRHHF